MRSPQIWGGSDFRRVYGGGGFTRSERNVALVLRPADALWVEPLGKAEPAFTGQRELSDSWSEPTNETCVSKVAGSEVIGRLTLRRTKSPEALAMSAAPSNAVVESQLSMVPECRKPSWDCELSSPPSLPATAELPPQIAADTRPHRVGTWHFPATLGRRSKQTRS